MTKAEPVSIRFDDEVMVVLKKLAAKDDRTISYVVNKLVTEQLKARRLLK
ncbi:MAG: hypothetical protein USCAAHI_01752 [Beijerinckiaceae bacterium]|nr:MAG: hypothetical protein USCAAHI_01752 [Beijerinckiaceae bacterium]